MIRFPAHFIERYKPGIEHVSLYDFSIDELDRDSLLAILGQMMVNKWSKMVTMTFSCFNCGKRAFLIHGLCRDCDPKLHRQHVEWTDFIRKAERKYQFKHDKKPLDDWYDFETFLESEIESGNLVMPIEISDTSG